MSLKPHRWKPRRDRRDRWLLGWIPPSAAERIALAVFAGMALAYVGLVPSFEGPDEPEHAAYVHAWATGGTVARPAPGGAVEWGLQIIQPPLYYAIVGGYARIVRAEFADRIAINLTQNPRFPYLRHDLPGQRFPWAREHRGLRLLRMPGVLFGVMTALILFRLGQSLFPGDPWARALWLGLALLTPNLLQSLTTVTNDGMALMLSTGGIALAVRLVRRPDASLWLFGGCGLVLSLAMLSKYLSIVAVLTVGTLLLIDLAVRRPGSSWLRGVAVLGAPLILLVGAHLGLNFLLYGDPTWESIAREMMPAFSRASPMSVGILLSAIPSFLPPRFAANLFADNYRVAWLGQGLFWLWLVASFAWLTRLVRDGFRGRSHAAEDWLPIVAFAWGLILLLWIGRTATSLNLRHVSAVWPVLMLPLVQWTRGSFARRRIRTVVIATVLLGLVGVNLGVLAGFRDFYVPAGRPDLDRDYHEFFYTYVQDRERARAYLHEGSTLSYDVEIAYRDRDLRRVVQLVEATAGPVHASGLAGSSDPSSHSKRVEYLYGIGLVDQGRSQEALLRLERIAPGYPGARPLYVELVMKHRSRAEARALLDRYLLASWGAEQSELRELRRQLGR